MSEVEDEVARLRRELDEERLAHTTDKLTAEQLQNDIEQAFALARKSNEELTAQLGRVVRRDARAASHGESCVFLFHQPIYSLAIVPLLICSRARPQRTDFASKVEELSALHTELASQRAKERAASAAAADRQVRVFVISFASKCAAACTEKYKH